MLRVYSDVPWVLLHHSPLMLITISPHRSPLTPHPHSRPPFHRLIIPCSPCQHASGATRPGYGRIFHLPAEEDGRHGWCVQCPALSPCKAGSCITPFSVSPCISTLMLAHAGVSTRKQHMRSQAAAGAGSSSPAPAADPEAEGPPPSKQPRVQPEAEAPDAPTATAVVPEAASPAVVDAVIAAAPASEGDATSDAPVVDAAAGECLGKYFACRPAHCRVQSLDASPTTLRSNVGLTHKDSLIDWSRASDPLSVAACLCQVPLVTVLLALVLAPPGLMLAHLAWMPALLLAPVAPPRGPPRSSPTASG